MRNLALILAQASMRVVLRVLSQVFPQSPSVVVAAFPDTEGNGVEVARALLRRYDGRVVWMWEGGVPPDEVRELAAHGLTLVPKASLRGLWHYLRAEAVFFTHGLYGSPKPAARKPIVNLWHGDGPKDIRPGKYVGDLIASTYLVGSTRLFSHYKGAAFDLPAEKVLLTGNPRTDQFFHSTRAGLEQLGITGDFVVWMPTFRQVRAIGAVRVWSHEELGDNDGRELARLLDGLRDRGLELVIKPHPMDADRRQWPGAVTVSEEDLVRAGISLYGLLGQSSGLVTDYSSVWVDYLLLDRPIAFLVGDRGSYARKLLPPDVLDWVPGEVVDHSDRPFAAFFADLDADGQEGATERAAVATRIGLNPTRTSADDLLTELDRRGVLSLQTEGVTARLR